MEIIYTLIPGNKIEDDVIRECSELFSSHYGIWGAEGPRVGKNVSMSPKQIRQNCLFDVSLCGVVLAYLDKKLVGHAFYCKYNIASGDSPKGNNEIIGKICWITQLVVDSQIRNRGIAKNLINILFDPDSKVCGMVTSHPYAVRSLEKATGYLVHPNTVSSLFPVIMKTMVVPYIKDKDYYCTPNGCIINTRFYVDHREILYILCNEMDKGTWILGGLPDGYEFIAIIYR